MSSYGIWLSAAGMKLSDHRQTLLTNNIANAQTTGFKHDLAVIMQRRVESKENASGGAFVHPVLDGLSGGFNVQPAYHDWAQGPIEPTGKPLDVAIEGDGFFTVSDGETKRYTRDGAFAMNEEGELVLTTESGRWRVLDPAGDAIRVDPTLGKVGVSGDGTIRQGNNVVGQIGLANVENRRLLRKVGENLFELTGGEAVPAKGRLVWGSLEGSNFDIMQGLATMIEASRMYQMNATMLQLQDQLTGQAVSTLGRVA